MSEELVGFLNNEGRSAKTWHDISAALKRRESEQNDLQAGWLMTAFDYHLTRRAGEIQSRDAWLFPDSKGGIVRNSNWLKRHWNPAREAAGLKDVKPAIGIHDLRRLSISRRYADKVELLIVLNRTGHTAEAMSLAYAQADPESDRRASEALGSWIFSAMSHLSRTA